MTEAFPWDTAPWYLLRDRDASYGPAFRDRIQVMGIKEVVTAPRSPWQNAYVERIIGSIRRECLDHIIIFNERHLRDVLSSYCKYHHKSRTHLSLGKDCPQPRPIQPPKTRSNRCLLAQRGCSASLKDRRTPQRTAKVNHSDPSRPMLECQSLRAHAEHLHQMNHLRV